MNATPLAARSSSRTLVAERRVGLGAQYGQSAEEVFMGERGRNESPQ